MSSSPTEAPANQGTLVDVEMPQLGVSVSEGTLVTWRKQVGDEVAYEEALCDVATDKIDVECPSPAAGIVAELLVEPDQTVPVGTVLARIRTGDAPAGETPSPAAGEPPHGGDAGLGEVPDPSPAPPAQPPAPAPPHPGPPDPGDPTPPQPDPAPPAEPNPQPPSIREPALPAFVSPVVRRIAAEHGIDTSTVQGSGRLGRVTKRDILRALREREAAAARTEAPMHIESPYREEEAAPAVNGTASAPSAGDEAAPANGAAQAPASEPVGEPLTRVRRLIGEHMRRSLDTAAHCTTIFEADMSAVERRRAQVRTTYLPIVARCVVDALREHPALNAWLQDDRLVRHEAVHLGIAVDLGDAGLVVPVIRDAQLLSDEGLAHAIRDLAKRARAGELRPGETDGGTFTITNPGALGAIAATPVISLPQVAILDLEAVVRRPVVVTGADGTEAIAIRPMTNLCLSWDHRALDGAAAARFLATLRTRLEAL
jgi:pyruvate/2-oxoglutarate dehydrogenase complex dihydrolipoamide acyltransferase (E2) component